MSINFFDVLGVNENASTDDIKKAYKKLAIQYHPDKNNGNKEFEEKFKQINEAYDTLKDENKRMSYIASLRGGFNTFNGFSFDDIFNDIFGGGFSKNNRPINRDIHLRYHITLEEVLTGKSTDISYSLPNGDKKNVKITIPPGIHNNSKIMFSGMGESTIHNIPSGNLFITIQILPHEHFIRHNVNLSTVIHIDYIEAMIGTNKIIDCLDGTKINVTIPKNSKPGNSLRVSGKGLPIDETNFGDMFVEILLYPPNLSDDQLEKIKKVYDT